MRMVRMRTRTRYLYEKNINKQGQNIKERIEEKYMRMRMRTMIIEELKKNICKNKMMN